MLGDTSEIIKCCCKRIVPMRVSICVPVFGTEKYIEECSRSLFCQTYKDIEYVFVDDCSPDNSIRILNDVIKDYPNRVKDIHIIRLPQNKGLAVARNTAIQSASGDFVFSIDSDDYLEYDAIDNLVQCQKATDSDIVTGLFYINENDVDTRYLEPVYTNKDQMLQCVLGTVWHHELCNRLVRRSLFVDYKIKAIPNVNICEDWQVVPRLVYYSRKCYTLERYTYHYRQNPESLVHSNSNWNKEKEGYRQEFLSMKVLLDFFQNTSYREYINTLYVNRQISNLDLGLQHNDKDFFLWCKHNLEIVPSEYLKNVSKRKLLSVKLGFAIANLFYYLHKIKKGSK